uniref:HORMA domain-containing protein n=1 Tax=Panagrolaimus sp. PS1159 TaxID=55785 RepID=A0AC35GSX8_9BILA
MPQKQKEFLDHLYPKDDKLLGREVDYLLRSASLICSTYAYHRKVLPDNAFKSVMINNVKNHMVFDKDHPKARMHREAIQAIEKDLTEKKIKQFTFGLCLENNPEKVVESLQFDFDYGEAAVNVKLPNATNVRITSKWDFADDLVE